MQAAYAKILHIVIAVVKKFIKHLNGLLRKVVVGVYVADCFDGLLEYSLAEMKSYVMEKLLEDKLVQ